jgi:hypothetical protein
MPQEDMQLVMYSLAVIALLIVFTIEIAVNFGSCGFYAVASKAVDCLDIKSEV